MSLLQINLQYDNILLLRQMLYHKKLDHFTFSYFRQAEGTVVDDLTLTRILKNGEPLPDDTSNAVEALIYEGASKIQVSLLIN